MKTLKLAVAVVALTCMSARAAEVKYGVADNIATAAIGGAFGYVVEQQLYLNSQADKSTKLRTLGYGAQLVTVSAATAFATFAALGLRTMKDTDSKVQAALLALLSAAAVYTYNSKSRVDQNELYEAINDASAAASAQAAAASAA